jgi:hypothetical protein
MSIPAFSVFSAASELVVTAGVAVVVGRNWNRKPFPLALFLAVALFEALVNVAYMANRTARAASGADPVSSTMRLAFALHGMISLLAYLWFVVLGVIASVQQAAGRFWFRDHRVHTIAFLIVWTISIVSGETMFVARYLL